MTLFSKGSSKWDSSLVSKVNGDKLTLNFITFKGNELSMTITFHKAITLFMDYVDYIANTNITEFSAPFDIFD